MNEKAQSTSQSRELSIKGDLNASSVTGPATVNYYNMSGLKRHWIPPAPQISNKKFVGRHAELNKLLAELAPRENMKITCRVLQGMGGIGKTSLAMRLAMDLYKSFPGGFIRIDVGPDVKDEASAQVPLRKLASYAFDGPLPKDANNQLEPEQVANWLSETATGPFLVIFDDLWYSVPLLFLNKALPPDAVQLVTTRNKDIAQSTDPHFVKLDNLNAADGLDLLEERLSWENYRTYRPILEKLVSLLDGHALALEIAAARIKWPSRLQTVYDGLERGNGGDRLASLKLSSGEDREVNLERSLALSYEHLTPEQKRLFRILGVFAEKTKITAVAVAKMWEKDDVNAVRAKLFELEDLALLTQFEDTTKDSIYFRQHGLLHAYALALLEKEEKAEDLPRIRRIHAQYYTDLSWQVSSKTPGSLTLLDQKSLTLLDQNMPNLKAALQWARDNDRSLFSSRVSALANFLLIRGQQLALFETFLPKAVDIAKDDGDKFLEVELLKNWGDLKSSLGELDEARSHYEAAFSLYHDWGVANLLKSRGDLESRLGKLDEASRDYNVALSLHEGGRDRLGKANLLKSRGDLEFRLGKLDEASRDYDDALPLYRDKHDDLGVANLLKSRGDLECRLGKLDMASRDYDDALPLYQNELDRRGVANLLKGLGDLESRLGKLNDARIDYEAALLLSRDERAYLSEAHVLKGLGDLESRLGNLDQACKDYDDALALYQGQKDQLGLANLLKSLGDLECRLDNLDEARSRYNEALKLSRNERARWSEANVLRSLGDLECRLGKLNEADSHYNEALKLSRNEHDSWGEANVLRSLGDLKSRWHNFNQAHSDYEAALKIYEHEHNPRGEADVYMSQGDMFLAQEKWIEAKTCYEKALPQYKIEDDPLVLANTFFGLKHARFELGDHEQAIQDKERAAEFFRRMKVTPRAERAEQYLVKMRLKLKQQ